MKINHLEILCDPHTGEDLEVIVNKSIEDEIIEGFLKSSSNTFKINNGIPRFVDEINYSDNFGWQWNKWARVQFEDENKNKTMEGHTRNMFTTITELDVWLGKKNKIKTYLKNNVYKTIPKARKKYLKGVIKYDGPILAPIKKGDIVAKLNIYYKDELINDYNLYASEDIKKVNVISRIIKSINFLIWGDV